MENTSKENTHQYLVTLKPIGSYFFGGENTFGDGAYQNYFVRSQDLPQVSAVMGVVRYAVLALNDALDGKNNANKQDELVGTHSFSLEEDCNYGIISSISPLFIKKDDKILTKIPFFKKKEDETLTPITECKFIQFKDCNSDLNKHVTSSGINYFSKGEHKNIIVEIDKKTFNFKDFSIESYWVDGDGKRYNGVITDDKRVGIRKRCGMPNDDKSYFVKVCKRLAKDCSFCFTMTLSQELPTNKVNEPLFVNLGGERSLFKMCFEKVNKDYDITNNFKFSLQNNCHLLLSDAYLSDDEHDEQWQSIEYVWGESKVNRFTSKTHNWNIKNKRKTLYRLLSRGSVIFGQIKNLNNSKLRQYGLNIFLNNNNKNK